MNRVPWLILGCGYTGTALARMLIDGGDRVVVTRREVSAARGLAAELGCEAEAVDANDPAAIAALTCVGAVVVNSVPPTGDHGVAERAVAEAVIAAGARRLVYLSSTGVYAPAGGRTVDESFPTEPGSEHGARRLAAEQATLSAAGGRAVSLRIAGIYGPGRGVVARMRADRYRILGPGTTLVNRVHVTDLAAAIALVGTVEPLPYDLVNVADDEPCSSLELAEFVVRELGLPPPPRVPLSEAGPMAAAMLGADRRIDNARLKSLGFSFRYPSYRRGVLAV